ncbi:multidrug resistance-associated protein 5-like [Oncorhynchus tshawytscha]|uniref:multidrug resistance-associated protein 5-like n=1 Tax=Oncorhynchus tshawytscha TaxID=74940 RepID=UPI000D09CB08|nr:multidrug resistance-associated protein 5-like [Oncorhynchus tshawytscha]
MKEHDLGKDYLVPGPVYRAVQSRDTLPGSEVTPYDLAKVQDALETAARAEGGLSLDGGAHYMKELEEEARSKYQHSGGVLKPIRSTSNHEHLVDNASLFSFMTFNWLIPLAVHAHRKGQLQLEDVWAVSQFESCKVNRHRLAGLWEEECRVKGDEASLCGVVWAFCRTRLLLSILCLMVTQLAGFSGPAEAYR